jgi:uncharacterized protein (DUF58 family)
MPQDVAEILRKVRHIQIVANRQVNDLLAGEYASVFKGRGMEFDEVREYTPGDEVRDIDWNVTARAGRPYVKRYAEERELTILFLVDVSASGAFGSTDRSKLEMIAEIAALLMFSALKNNDKVGLCLFADRIIQFLPPRKGKANVLRFIRELVAAEPVAGETDLTAALEYAARVLKRRAVVFLVSDFQGEDYERSLRLTNRRHDVVAITVGDRRELALPDVGFITLRDPETGGVRELDTRHPRVRRLFETRATEAGEALGDALKRSGVDQLGVRTDQPYVTSIHRFFRMREKRFR